MSTVGRKDAKDAHIENSVHEDIYTVGICSSNCPNQLFFGSPPSRDGPFLIELAKVPLRKSTLIFNSIYATPRTKSYAS